MKLQTQIPLQQAAGQIDYQSQLLLLGSCFVENMGQKLGDHKFRSTVNPIGILFHPKAIETFVSRSIRGSYFTTEDVFLKDGFWYCFDAHSNMVGASSEALLDNLNRAVELTASRIKECSHIVITLGTAWVYRHKKSKSIVANCHKVPQKEFDKELLSVDVIASSLQNIARSVHTLSPDTRIIFTISPVRHLKDGFVENQRSKAHLIAAVHQMVEENASLNGYFPSYELLMDELRDYRFYNTDMLHPNQLAIDYIWEKFKNVWISQDAYPTMEKVESIQKGLRHKPFHPESEQHRKFTRNLDEQIKKLQAQYPFMQF